MRYQMLFPEGRGLTDYFDASWRDEVPLRAYEVVYEGEISPVQTGYGEIITEPLPEETLGALWQRHNVGDAGDGNRPGARQFRSACVGDVFVFPETDEWYLIDPIGWVLLEPTARPRVAMPKVSKSEVRAAFREFASGEDTTSAVAKLLNKGFAKMTSKKSKKRTRGGGSQ